MISRLRRLLARLSGTADLPAEFTGSLQPDEDVLAVARTAQGPLVATSLGLWVQESGTARRIGWHLVSKATWSGNELGLVESEERGHAGDAVLLRDLPLCRFHLDSRGWLPETVHARVTGSIRSSHHRALPGGGAWFVQRKVPGQDGIVLQVRADKGTDEAAVTMLAREVAERMQRIRRRPHD